MKRLLLASISAICILFVPLSAGQNTPSKPSVATTYFGWEDGGASIYSEIANGKAILMARCGSILNVVADSSFTGSWNTSVLRYGVTVSTNGIMVFGDDIQRNVTHGKPCPGAFPGIVRLARLSSREEAIKKSNLDADSVAEYKAFHVQAYGVEPSARVAQSEAIVRPVEAKPNVDEERIRREVQARLEEERKQRVAQARTDEDRQQRDSLAAAEDARRQREMLTKAEDERRQREVQAKVEEDRRQREVQAKAEEERRQREVQAKAEEARKQAVAVPRITRKAPVIGNDSYASVPKLRSARTDASAIEQAFLSAGYSVSAHYDVNEREMKRVIREFVRRVEGGDEVFFFFAGHGVQLGGANYLLPTDIRAEDATAVRDEAISLQRVMDDLAESKARLTLAVIDACRDNPFAVAGRAVGGRGLAATNVASGQMIVFSAGAGQQALDHVGPNDRSPNGLFTRVFLKHIRQKGITIDRIMRQVRAEVMQVAKSIGHDQVPALYDQVVGDFYFVP